MEQECKGPIHPVLRTWLCCSKACLVKASHSTIYTVYVLVLLQRAVIKMVGLLVEQNVSALYSSPPLVFLPPCLVLWLLSIAALPVFVSGADFGVKYLLVLLCLPPPRMKCQLLTESLSPGQGKGHPCAARISPPLLANVGALRQGPTMAAD